MKQTAVEWLGKELESYGDPEYCKLEWETLDPLIQQAKEMEKEQIINFAEDYQINESEKYPQKTFEQYYNETFKSK